MILKGSLKAKMFNLADNFTNVPRGTIFLLIFPLHLNSVQAFNIGNDKIKSFLIFLLFAVCAILQSCNSWWIK